MESFIKAIRTIILTLTTIILTLTTICIASLCGGIVLSITWGWFIVPVFHLPTMTALQGIGVNFVVGIPFTYVAKQKDTSIDDIKTVAGKMMYALFKSVSSSILTIGLAAILHWIIG